MNNKRIKSRFEVLRRFRNFVCRHRQVDSQRLKRRRSLYKFAFLHYNKLPRWVTPPMKIPRFVIRGKSSVKEEEQNPIGRSNIKENIVTCLCSANAYPKPEDVTLLVFSRKSFN